ncbi:MAG: redoxin domain-containing protein [Planctomycetes bacterium]|nr:redoxin domain-containing protein [Planctomycetota bacterium]
MRHGSRFTMITAVLAATFAAGAGVAPAGKAPRIGAPAPALELPDTTGRLHRLDRYRGRIVVLEWTDPRCPFVGRLYQTGAMRATYRKVRSLDRSVVWLAVNSNHDATVSGNTEWIATHRLEYPILLDPDGAAGRRFDARRAPHVFVVDRAGVLRYQGAIDDNRLGSASPEDVTNYLVDAVNRIVQDEEVDPEYVKPYGCAVKYRK